MNKVKAFINPQAGRVGMANNLIQGLESFRNEGLISRLEIVLTESEEASRKRVMQEDHSDFDFLLAAGGDGTINNIVNGLLAGGQEIPLLICAAGTVNDFGVANALPQDLADLKEILKHHQTMPVDVGEANGVNFLNVAAGGFLSEISFLTPRTMKMFLGQFAYYLTAAVNIHQILRPYPLKITGDHFEIEDHFFFFTFGNCQSIGGFRNLVPDANVQDGLFDLLCLRADPHYLRPTILPLLIDVLNGGHLSHPAIFHTKSSRLRIESSRDIIIDLDGEEGPHLPVELKVKKRALNLIVPLVHRTRADSKLELV